MTTNHMDEDELLGKAYDARLIKRLAGYMRPYALLIGVGVFLVLAVAALQVAGPLVVRRAIDHQITPRDADGLGTLVLIYMGLLAAIFVLSFIQAVLITYVGQRVMMDLRLDLFQHVQKMSISFFDRNPVGRLVTRLTNDVSTLEMMLSQGIIETMTNVVMLIAIVGVLLWLDWKLALAMLILVPLLMFAIRQVAALQRDNFREQRAWLARINAFLNENITGISVIQLFNLRDRNLLRFDERNNGMLNANLRGIFLFAVAEPIVVLFNAATTGLVIWYGGGRVLDDTLTIGTLVAFIQYMQRFYWPIRDLADRYTILQQSMASCERIFNVLDEQAEIADDASARDLADVQGKIEFRNVWFAYDPGNWVLRDVSFVIEPGEKVAVVGSTGAGKSTMMSLLNRFYDVQQGQILVDDVPITELKQRSLRRNVGLVLQDPFMFSDTVAENIRMRDQSISLDAVRAAAKMVGAEPFIARMAGGYDSMLAERGANLSTGQKQLIALARVAAFNPQIVLVMDEATASIDPETEATLQASIREVMTGRSSIIIAHRLNTIRFVDRILVLQHGEVVEEGSHEELLALHGAYSSLYELQYKDQDIGVV